jgi:hypothetical protein
MNYTLKTVYPYQKPGQATVGHADDENSGTSHDGLVT